LSYARSDANLQALTIDFKPAQFLIWHSLLQP